METRPPSGLPEGGFSSSGNRPAERDLAAFAAGARTLDERLAEAPPPESGPSSAAGAPARVDAWIRAVAAGDGAAFRRRLAWDGLDEERLIAALTRPVVFRRGELPSWTGTLADALARSQEVRAELLAARSLSELAGARGDDSPRFAEVWVPFVRSARERLRGAVPSAPALLAPDALRDLERGLLASIAWLGEATLYDRFDAARREEGGGRSGVYARFVEELLSDGLLPLFREYPVLARLAATVCDTWVEATSELLARLEADREPLARIFGAEGVIEACLPALSDRHFGGRTVHRLFFSSGVSLAYKPRTVAAEAAWNALLETLARMEGGPRLPSLRVLDRGGWGWVEWAGGGNLSSVAEAEIYFRKTGSLLAVAWLFGATDLHRENVVANDAGPVVVDAEMILAPVRKSGGTDEPPDGSFLRTGLLTTPGIDAEGRSIDIGGFRGAGGFPTAAKRRTFRHVNTDSMVMALAPAVAEETPNRPRLGGRSLLPDDFPEAVADGFAAAGRFLLLHRDEIVRADGPLARFGGIPVRFVLRTSDLYARLLADLAVPAFLADGVFRSFALDSMNRPYVRGEERPPFWPLVREEREALSAFDIPYFSLDAAGTAVLARDGEAALLFSRSGLEATRERLDLLTGEEISRQVELLRAHLAAAAPAAIEGTARTDGAVPVPLSDAELFAAAAAAGGLVRDALARPGGLLPLDLYAGRAGAGLLLSALRATGAADVPLREIAAAFREIRETLDRDEELLPGEGLGVLSGAGSVVYALTVTFRLTNEGDWLDLAARAASRLTPARIAADRRFDVEGGAAGALLGLLALHQASARPEVLESALLCGRHLLAGKVETGGGGIGWPSAGGPPLAGFAHGAAGIALALSRLAAVSGRSEYAEASRRACLYERSVYDPREGNWPVLGSDDGTGRPRLLTAWCHGAPGIALSRLGLPAVVRDAALEQDLEAALETVRRTPLLPTDHLCCGNAGLVETLVAAAERLERPGLAAEARGRIAACLARARNGGFRLGDGHGAPSGLFRGLAGIAFTLLRLAAPGRLPSVLLFDVEPASRFLDPAPRAVLA